MLMAPPENFQLLLDQRRAHTDDNSELFESIPALSEADVPAVKIRAEEKPASWQHRASQEQPTFESSPMPSKADARSGSAKSQTADWRFELKELAQEHHLPGQIAFREAATVLEKSPRPGPNLAPAAVAPPNKSGAFGEPDHNANLVTSTVDWLLEMEQLATEHRLPETEDSTSAAASEQAETTAAAATASAAARGRLGDGIAEAYSSRADAPHEVWKQGGNMAREAAMLLSAAEAYLDEEDAAEALTAALAAENLLIPLGDWISVADVLGVVLASFRLLEKNDDASKAIEERLAKVRAAGEQEGEAAVLSAAAEFYFHGYQEDVGGAQVFQLAREAEQAAASASNTQMQAAALLIQSFLHLREDRPVDALKTSKEALSISHAAGDSKGEAKAKRQVAEVSLKSRHLPEAKHQAKEARKLFKELGCKRAEGSVLLLDCDIHIAIGTPTEGFRSASEALEIFREINFCKGQDVALRRAVDALIATEDAPGAVSFAKDAAAWSSERGEGRAEVSSLLALASACLAGDRHSLHHAPADALDAAQKALVVCRNMGDRRREGTALQLVAEMHVMNDQPTAAAHHFTEALQRCREFSDVPGQANALLAMASVHASWDPQVALAEAKEARKLMEKTGDKKMVAAAFALISSIHRTLGEYEKAEASAGMAREVCHAAGDKVGEASGLLEIAAARLECGEGMASAMRAAKEAEALLRAPGGKQERRMLEDTVHWMASVHFQADEPVEALRVAKKGESVLRKMRASTDHEKARMKLLSAHAKLEVLWQLGEQEPPESRKLRREFEGVLRTVELAVRLARSVGDVRMLASALYTLGHTYWFGNRPGDALHAVEEAASLLYGSKDSQLVLRTFALLAQSQEACGDASTALATLDDAHGKALDLGDMDGADGISVLRGELAAKAPSETNAAWPPAAESVPTDVPSVAAAREKIVIATPVLDAVYTYTAPEINAVRKAIAALVQSIIASDDPIDEETPLMEAGLDSLSSVELRTQLQQEFGYNVRATAVFNYPSIAALSEYIVDECTSRGVSWG